MLSDTIKIIEELILEKQRIIKLYAGNSTGSVRNDPPESVAWCKNCDLISDIESWECGGADDNGNAFCPGCNSEVFPILYEKIKI